MQFTSLPETDHPAVMLRPLVATDLPAWFADLSLPAVFEHTSWNLQSPSQLSHYVSASDPVSASSLVRMAIAQRSTGALVGTIGFHSVSPENRSAELAFDLSPVMWGKGIATHLVQAVTQWAHAHVGLVRIQATTLVSNSRSVKVLERCSFQREGLLHSYRQVYRAAMFAAGAAAVSYAFAGRSGLAAGAAGMVLLAFILRRQVISKMDSLRAQIEISGTDAIPKFRPHTRDGHSDQRGSARAHRLDPHVLFDALRQPGSFHRP